MPRRILTTLITNAVLALAAHPAFADPVPLGPPSLEPVIGRLQTWLAGLLVTLATLALTVGGVRYLFASGDPAQVERAKIALRSAAVGYGLAALASTLVGILRWIVGA